MDDATKSNKLGTPADFLRHAEALIKFEADMLGKAHAPRVSSLEELMAPAPFLAADPDAEPSDKKKGAVVAFPGPKKKKKKDPPS